MISRCSSPMPEMIVWFVSGSVWTRNVGSSSASLTSPFWQLVLVGLGLRLDGDGDHRLGELHRLEDDRLASRRTSVSPVFTSLRPMAAAMSPANTSSRSSRLLACICRMRPTRSRLSFVALKT